MIKKLNEGYYSDDAYKDFFSTFQDALYDSIATNIYLNESEIKIEYDRDEIGLVLNIDFPERSYIDFGNIDCNHEDMCRGLARLKNFAAIEKDIRNSYSIFEECQYDFDWDAYD